jgi:hypothetical protein
MVKPVLDDAEPIEPHNLAQGKLKSVFANNHLRD